METHVVYAGIEYVIRQDTTVIRNKFEQASKSGHFEWVGATTIDEPSQSVALAFGQGIPLVIIG